LGELENILKAFYSVDFNMIKENLDTTTNTLNMQLEKGGVPTTGEDKRHSLPPADNVSPCPELMQSTSEVTRTQNILSFFDEIPTTSKQNFTKSPGKVRTERISSLYIFQCAEFCIYDFLDSRI